MAPTFTFRFTLGVVLVGFCLLSLGATTKPLFQAGYEGQQVLLDWDVPNETGVLRYEIARKTPGEADYRSLFVQASNGQNHYRFVDASAPAPSSTVSPPASYRLTIHTNGGAESLLSAPTLLPTPLERSWSSVLAMFR